MVIDYASNYHNIAISVLIIIVYISMINAVLLLLRWRGNSAYKFSILLLRKYN